MVLLPDRIIGYRVDLALEALEEVGLPAYKQADAPNRK
jgi:hypothetical protein